MPVIKTVRDNNDEILSDVDFFPICYGIYGNNKCF